MLSHVELAYKDQYNLAFFIVLLLLYRGWQTVASGPSSGLRRFLWKACEPKMSYTFLMFFFFLNKRTLEIKKNPKNIS